MTMIASLNLKLKREMVTETSLTYAIDFGIDSDVVATDITLFDSLERAYF